MKPSQKQDTPEVSNEENPEENQEEVNEEKNIEVDEEKENSGWKRKGNFNSGMLWD